MIYTLTLNPSIDYIVHVNQLTPGELNRSEKEAKFPGGKGINVSRILKQLDTPSIPLGFIGGFTGQFIQDQLLADGLTPRFTKIADDSRINVKVKGQQETEINGQGPALTAENIAALKDQLANLTAEDIVVLAGSIPSSLPHTFYQELIAIIQEKKAEFVIDTTGDSLLASLANKPLLIKPNHHELAEMFNTTFHSIEEMIPYGKELLARGAKNVLVSLGKDGALLFTPTSTYQSVPIVGKLRNSVGAGDSMVAGFISRLALDPTNLEEAFRYGLAAGSATAFADDLATQTDILDLVPTVSIRKLN